MNYSKLSDKKLNALMETASTEEKALIQQELEARQAARAAQAQEYVDEEPLTPEQEKALAEAEANGGKAKKPVKMTDEELSAFAEECKKNIGHKCQVVPFNTIEWVDGVIVAVIAEKRSNKVMYSIKCDNGKKLNKIHGSELLRILDEVVETSLSKRTKSQHEAWTEDQFNEEMSKVIGNVGKTITFGEETGRIIAVIADKRTNSLLYKISQDVEAKDGEPSTKIVHKVVTADVQIAEEFDEAGQELHDKYMARRERRNAVDKTPEGRVLKCEENLKLAAERLAKAQEAYDKAKAALEAAKAELAGKETASNDSDLS